MLFKKLDGRKLDLQIYKYNYIIFYYKYIDQWSFSTGFIVQKSLALDAM